MTSHLSGRDTQLLWGTWVKLGSSRLLVNTVMLWVPKMLRDSKLLRDPKLLWDSQLLWDPQLLWGPKLWRVSRLLLWRVSRLLLLLDP